MSCVRFAIDWLPGEAKLRVLYGRVVPMVCTLRIEPGYPQQGRVLLERVNDITPGEKLDKVKASDQGSYTSWKSWNILNFCSDNFQAWKVLENERKSWKTPGKIKLWQNPCICRNYPLSCYSFSSESFSKVYSQIFRDQATVIYIQSN